MPTTRRTAAGIALTALALGSAVTLSACSSSPEPAPTKAASSSAAPSETPIGGDTLPPIMISEDMTTATAKVGDTLYFNVANPTDWTIESDNTMVATVAPGTVDGTSTSAPTGTALAAGTAKITLKDKTSGEAWEVTVTVTDEGGTPGAGLPAPIMVTPGTEKVDAKVGNALNFEVADPNQWAIVSDNPSVVSVTQGGTEGSATMNPGGEALAAGSATITLEDKTTKEAWIVVVTVTP